jgi:hypothetical protein
MTLYFATLTIVACVALPRVKPEGRLAYLCREYRDG